MLASLGKRLSPSMVVALGALFVALSGTTYAATGGKFTLGAANDANATTKLSSTSPSSPTLSVSGSAAGTVLQATNTTNAIGNGVQGTTNSIASGVYGENTGNGYGIAGRTGSKTSAAVYGQNTGGGPALELLTKFGVAPIKVNSNTKVTNLNADLLDGADASALARGQTYTNAFSIGKNEARNVPLGNLAFLHFACVDTTAYVSVTNLSNALENVFWSRANGTLYYDVIGTGDINSLPASFADMPTLELQATPNGVQTLTTANIAYKVRDSDCHFQIQALTTQQQ